jgi:hypothetical protein
MLKDADDAATLAALKTYATSINGELAIFDNIPAIAVRVLLDGMGDEVPVILYAQNSDMISDVAKNILLKLVAEVSLGTEKLAAGSVIVLPDDIVDKSSSSYGFFHNRCIHL